MYTNDVADSGKSPNDMPVGNNKNASNAHCNLKSDTTNQNANTINNIIKKIRAVANAIFLFIAYIPYNPSNAFHTIGTNHNAIAAKMPIKIAYDTYLLYFPIGITNSLTGVYANATPIRPKITLVVNNVVLNVPVPPSFCGFATHSYLPSINLTSSLAVTHLI